VGSAGVKRPVIVRLSFAPNRTPVARRRSATRARHTANYFAFGRQLEGEQRGVWYGPEATPFTHDQVMTWVKEQAMQHELTFQAVLSIPEGQLSAEDYCRAMAAGGDVVDWRLVCHDDTAHSHAHVLFFRDEQFEKSSYLEWHGRVSQSMAAMHSLVMNHDTGGELVTGSDVGQESRAYSSLEVEL
jgi:hypothetical protein